MKSTVVLFYKNGFILEFCMYFFNLHVYKDLQERCFLQQLPRREVVADSAQLPAAHKISDFLVYHSSVPFHRFRSGRLLLLHQPRFFCLLVVVERPA